jgi:hypothetical protein
VIDLEKAYPGIVLPAHYNLPGYKRTLGPEVGAINTLANFAPDPEQQLGLDMTFARNENGRSTCSEIGCLCCRQNLKTGLIKQVELGWLFVTDERLVVHSAHEFSTAREAYRDLKEIIEACPPLLRRIKGGGRDGFKDTPADMSIETVTGARLIFKTRTKGGGRGLSGRKIVLDEAFALEAQHMGALRPLISAQPDPQLIYASSACLEDSEVLRTIVERGRKGNEPRLGYLEWCIGPAKEICQDGEACSHVYGQAVGCGLDKPEQWQQANPAMGRRIEQITIEDERRACVSIELAHQFGRERGGWHDAPAGGTSPITAEQWEDSAEIESKIVGALALSVDIRPDGLAATIAVSGRNEDGKTHAEITGTKKRGLDSRPGTAWIVSRIVKIFEKHDPSVLILDPSGPAGALIPALLEAGFVKVSSPDEDVPVDKWRLYLVSGREYAQACGALVMDIREEAFRHIDQKPLNDAVDGARTRPLADAWAWSRKDTTVDISPLVAATLARHGFAVFGGEVELEPWAFTA